MYVHMYVHVYIHSGYNRRQTGDRFHEQLLMGENGNYVLHLVSFLLHNILIKGEILTTNCFIKQQSELHGWEQTRIKVSE